MFDLAKSSILMYCRGIYLNFIHFQLYALHLTKGYYLTQKSLIYHTKWKRTIFILYWSLGIG